MAWGYHLHLDCGGCAPSRISDGENIRRWLEDLLQRIDMEPVGPTMLERTAMHDPDKAGYTLMQCIQTSGVMAHFIDATRQAYIDVFSCKPFNDADVYDCVSQWFGPESIKTLMLERQA